MLRIGEPYLAMVGRFVAYSLDILFCPAEIYLGGHLNEHLIR